MHEKSTVLRVADGRSVPDALKHVLVELGNRHYVETQAGKSRLFASTFQDFVRTERARAPKGSFLRRLLGR